MDGVLVVNVEDGVLVGEAWIDASCAVAFVVLFKLSAKKNVAVAGFGKVLLFLLGAARSGCFAAHF